MSKTAVLPNGTSVACIRPAEARSIYREVQEYFDQGLEVRPGDTVLDVGANIGLFALEVSRRTGGQARVYSFEPIPQIFRALRRNLRRHPNVRCLKAGVADREGRLGFTYFPNASASSTAFRSGGLADQIDRSIFLLRTDPTYAPDRWLLRLPRPILRLERALVLRAVFRGVRVTCPTVTLSRVIARHRLDRVDLIKLDVEGAEVAALEGLRPEHWPRVRRIAVEVHDLERDLPRIERMLAEHRFQVTRKFHSYGSAESGSATLYASAS